ncbi:MAG TPA: hypothetical protein VHW24_07250, partial [Bryobacteraceae bacterium]|nr:hypothetical protein [Bryobacteraceae bacterium]
MRPTLVDSNEEMGVRDPAVAQRICLASIYHIVSTAARDKGASTSLRLVTVLEPPRPSALTGARLVPAAFSRASLRNS